MHMKKDNVQFKLNLHHIKNLSHQTVKYAKLVCKFTEKVKISNHLLKPLIKRSLKIIQFF